jgi:hypothetical protein
MTVLIEANLLFLMPRGLRSFLQSRNGFFNISDATFALDLKLDELMLKIVILPSSLLVFLVLICGERLARIVVVFLIKVTS